MRTFRRRGHRWIGFLPPLVILAGAAAPWSRAQDTVPASPATTSTPAAPTAIPPRPDDPRAARVYAVFEAHCARCHQAGRLERNRAAGGVANILALGEIGANPLLVRPGVPDASRLYDLLINRHAPADAFGTGGEGKEPGPDDIENVRAWIRALPTRDKTCAGREPIKPQAVEGWIDEAQRVGRDGAKDLRFLSLVNLYNTCVPVAEITAARQALAKLMNSLSWAAAPKRLDALDPDGTLLAFRLSDFGWVEGHWDVLTRAYPKALVTPLAERLRSTAATGNPVIRGDWLAEALSDPKLYAGLLGLPNRLSELAKMNGIDVDYNVRIARARRAVVRNSTVTRGNRLAERHPGARGGFWLIHDFSSSSGDQDLFEHPLGPKLGGNVKAPFKADLVRVQFALPNGFFAYALFDTSGTRLDQVLPGVEAPEYSALQAPVRAGRDCFVCHSDGVKALRDDYRAQFQPPSGASPVKDTSRDAALQLSATDGEMVLLRDADNERHRGAQLSAGVDPALTSKGEEIISALARRYREGTDFQGVAVEMGLEPAALETALSGTSGANAVLARRLQTDWLARADLDPLLAYLKGAETREGSATKQPASGSQSRIGLNLWTDKVKPAPGDLITVRAESDTDCYLTLINVDAAGKATVLFPNDFEPDNLVSAGKAVQVPGAAAPYQLRRKDEGSELLLGQCSTSPAPPTGIDHEFGRQRFTVLGNWENFVHDTLIADSDLRRNPEKAERARNVRAQARRRERATSDPPERGDTAPGRNLIDGRAVVVLDKG